MRTIATCILLLGLHSVSFSQTVQWLKGRDINYSMNPQSLNYSVAVSPDGSVWFGGMGSFVEFYNQAMGDLFLTHFNGNGDTLMDLDISGSALLTSIKPDLDGNIYISGQFLDSLHFWNGTMLSTSFPSSISGFLARVSASGNLDWAINLSDLYPDGVPEDLCIHENHVYISISQWPESSIAEFDASGNLLSTITQSNVNIASGIAFDTAGNLYVTGSCSNFGTLFGGIPYSSPFTYTMYLARYNPLGTPDWVTFTEDVTFNSPKIKINQDGNIIWAGPLDLETTFDTITLQGPSWVYDFFITAYNPEGHALWGFEVPQVLTGDAGIGTSQPFCFLPDNSISMTGVRRGSIDWGNGVISQGNITDMNTLVLGISPDGQALWSKTGQSSGYDQGLCIDSDPDGNLYIGGVAHGTLTFDTCSYTGASFYYPFLVKMHVDVQTGLTRQNRKEGPVIYPNPAHDRIFINPGIGEKVDIRINSVDGKELIHLNGWNTAEPIDIRSWPPGLYLLHLIDGNYRTSVKLVVN